MRLCGWLRRTISAALAWSYLSLRRPAPEMESRTSAPLGWRCTIQAVREHGLRGAARRLVPARALLRLQVPALLQAAWSTADLYPPGASLYATRSALCWTVGSFQRRAGLAEGPLRVFCAADSYGESGRGSVAVESAAWITTTRRRSMIMQDGGERDDDSPKIALEVLLLVERAVSKHVADFEQRELSRCSITSSSERAAMPMAVAPSFDPLPPSPRGSMLPTTNVSAVSIRNGHFVDAQGRVRILRGVNLGGSSKLPFGYQHTDRHSPSNFFDGARSVSFVNRPFPLSEAPVHFARLQRWGLTLLRFIVTWEAIEHGGPGVFDREYLSYIREIIAIAADYGLSIYVDPHQDVWSRWTGGDGAPMWTLEAVGLDPRNFETTKAALCVETCGLEVSKYPKMIWPTNYFKMACATMFSLFWGGSKCAPSCRVNGVPVQEYLQSHYLDAMAQLAEALRGLTNVVGFGTMNEPSSGYLGLEDLSKHFHHGELKYDLAPTPFQGMVLADGYQQVIQRWSNGANQHVLGRPDELLTVDPNGVRAWQQGRRCVWREEGVWDVDGMTGQPVLLRPDHFAGIMFGRDCYVPFAARFAERMRSILPHILLFVELPPLEFSIDEFPEIDDTLIPRAVNATHWYDGVTLFLQAWRPYFTVDPRTKRPAFGSAAVRRTHLKQLAGIKVYGNEQMNNAPTLIGETGIPFNMHGKKAFRNGDFSAQVGALDNTISCLEASLVSFTLWCYTSDNCNDYGDQWNLEDLSLISRDKPIRSGRQLSVPERDACARAIQAFARPYATRIAGTPSKSEFLLDRVRYELEYVSDPAKSAETSMYPTEVFVPQLQYPHGYSVETSDGHFSVEAHDGWDTVSYLHDASKANHWLVISSKDESIEKRRRARIVRRRVLTPPLLALCAYILYLIFG